MSLITAALLAIEDIFSAEFRAITFRICLITLALMVALAIVGIKLVIALAIVPHWAWLTLSIHILAGLVIVIGLPFLAAPLSFAVATFFFDTLAARVERACALRVGRPVPLRDALYLSLAFGTLSLAVNTVALLLLLVPGVNAIAFFAANAFLLGRGFFELAALRYCSMDAMRELRRRHSTRILLAGTCCAALAVIPVLNLLTPLFATALMVRVAQPLIANRELYRAV